jgi:hypothetical protein
MGNIFTSTDRGANWTARDSARDWFSVASSADGNKLVAAVSGGQLYTSTDSGVTWLPRDSARNWSSVTSSADGNKLVAAVNGGQLYTSTDGGVTWVPRESAKSWSSVASSADGSKLVAVALDDQPHTSTDSGVTWVAREFARNWSSVASSADGTKLVAVVHHIVAPVPFGQVYTSVPAPFHGAPGESAELWFTASGKWVPLVISAANLTAGTLPDARLSPNVPLLSGGKLNDSVLGVDVARRTGGNAFTGNQSIVGGSAAEPFPQLSIAAAPEAPYGAFVSVDATATSGGKDYLIYSTGGSAGEGTGKLVTKNQTDNRIVQTLTADGKAGFGTFAPAVRLHVKQQTDNGGFAAANDGIQLEAASGEYWRLQTQAAGDLVFDSGLGSGYAYISRNSGSFNITSDARFKRDVQPLGPLLDRVLALEPVTFRYLHAPADSPPVVGFIAQQVLPLFPEVVDEKDGQYAIGYDAFGPIAIGAIQELNTKLEAKLAAKDAEVAELKSRLEKLERLVNEKLGGGQ